MNEDADVLELLTSNADQAAEFLALVASAATQEKCAVVFREHKIKSDGLMGLTPLDPGSESMQYSYGL